MKMIDEEVTTLNLLQIDNSIIADNQRSYAAEDELRNSSSLNLNLAFLLEVKKI